MSNHVVLVCGGRAYGEAELVDAILSGLAKRPTRIIQGGASGADYLAFKWAAKNRIPVDTFPADWSAHGRAAGPMRNARMLEVGKPDLVVAFPGGQGTSDMVRRARAAGVRVLEVPKDEEKGEVQS